MAEKTWTVADMAAVNSKLHIYVLQMMIMKGLVSKEEVQVLANSFMDARNKEEDVGARDYARLLLNDIPGISA